MSMDNSDNSTIANLSSEFPPVPYSETYWIISEVVLTVLTLFAVYIFACLARYASITKCKPGRDISGKKGKSLYQLCLLSVAMAVARLVSDQAVAITGWQSDSGCVMSVAFSTVFYSLSLYPVYIFLWMRQSIFYANPVLSHVLNPAVTLLSYTTLFIMLSGGAVLTVLYLIPEITGWKYEASPIGCRDTAHRSGFDLVPMLLVCFTVIFQLSLLALFMYPLFTKKTQTYRSSNRFSHGNGNSLPNGKHYDSLSETPDGNGAAFPETVSDTKEKALTQDDNVNSVNSLCKQDATNYDPEQMIRCNSNCPSIVEISIKKGAPAGGKIVSQSFVTKKNVFYRKTPSEHKEEKKNTNKKRISTSSVGDILKRNKCSHSNGIWSDGKETRKFKRSRTQQGQRVMRFIRKAFVLTLICVISDVIFTVVQLMIVAPELVYLVLFDVNLMINSICIIMSFRDWPHMILPFCSKCRGGEPRLHSHDSTINGRYSQARKPLYTINRSRFERGKLQQSNASRTPENSNEKENITSSNSAKDDQRQC